MKAHELSPPLNVTPIRSFDDLPKLQDFFRRIREGGQQLGWDIETNPLKDYFYRRCRTIQFGNQAEQYVIDLLPFCDGNPDILHKAQGNYGRNLTSQLGKLLETLQPVVCTKDFLKVGVNLSFEYMSFYWLFGMRTFHFFDNALVEKCINAGSHSLKDYGFYSMEEMMGRYFGVQIDKTLQESFTLDVQLSDEQLAYAALDTRFPLALKAAQELILSGVTAEALVKRRSPNVALIRRIDPLLTGDKLEEIAAIENEAIGSFQDMHIHGERLDTDRWRSRIVQKKAEFASLITDTLDPIFLPLVGSKLETLTDADIEAAKARWKALNGPSDAELKFKPLIRQATAVLKKNPEDAVAAARLAKLQADMNVLIDSRKREKERLKAEASVLGKKRTKIKNLAAKCEGQALIKYGSNAQLLVEINKMPGLARVTNLEDETLEKFAHIPVMAAIRRFHGLTKEIGTYGDQWATQWVTKPCKEEGWLHPGDGRLHCVFNQYDAETGRSSSEKPNGQNLPQDTEVRECFIADAPDEQIRISDCCEADTQWEDGLGDGGTYVCQSCQRYCSTHAEEFVIVTADMSGAELRIIAELSGDPVWIAAFARGEDVHSVGTELLYGEKWVELTQPGCKYYRLKENGEPAHEKCKCPGHEKLRNETKAINFLLAYGGGPGTLAKRLKITLERAKELMLLHASKFPAVWRYLENSGKTSGILKRSYDMFGRRRLFPKPDWERAKAKAKEDKEETLRLDEAVAKANLAKFIEQFGRKPDTAERWALTHRQPVKKEINQAYVALGSSIQRQGKNHAIQGTNATIAKKAMGSGYCPEGKPYLWHTLPLYKAMLLKFVHDELVVQCPKRYAQQVTDLIGDAFRRAAAEKMTQVVMEFDAHTAAYWKK